MHTHVLQRSWYMDHHVTDLARLLLGKVLATTFDGLRTAAVITETEAYVGAGDRASHAYGDRRTPRTAPMYGPGGHAYVYLCYGIHHLFNVVAGPPGTPHAVLVRAAFPVEGIAVVGARRAPAPPTMNGPGTVGQGMGIHVRHTGLDLCAGPITIEDHGHVVPPARVIAGPRVGVDYAGPDARLPYRFRVAPSWPAPWKDK
ncbi:MAG: DNA-3-methyladenine glycosylase [Flavobacteriales bacterium]|jgi:DNA-3-methyladenine glycosylase|nr:DNA-3-methyladenine glycosylase [Flavobacteriales bacterium]